MGGASQLRNGQVLSDGAGQGYSPWVFLGPDAGLELEAVPGHILGQFVNDRLDVGRRWDDGGGRGGGLGSGLGGQFLFGAGGKKT